MGPGAFCIAKSSMKGFRVQQPSLRKPKDLRYYKIPLYFFSMRCPSTLVLLLKLML